MKKTRRMPMTTEKKKKNKSKKLRCPSRKVDGKAIWLWSVQVQGTDLSRREGTF
jgi:hypothetical protein